MNSKPGKADQSFLKEAIEGDLAKINMGKLAQQKGQSQELKQFGHMLEQDHGQHLQKAKDTAQQMDLPAPTEPNAKQKKMYDQVNKLSGAVQQALCARDGERSQGRHQEIPEGVKIEKATGRFCPANYSDPAKALADRGTPNVKLVDISKIAHGRDEVIE